MPQVLIVDDEASVRDMAERALSQVGLQCETAGDGQEALERYEAKNHDAVLTDLRMPRRHGHSLAVELLGRKQPPCVVVMTAFTEQRLLHELMRRGVEDVFWKPFDFNSLARRMMMLTEKQQAMRSTAPPPAPPAEHNALPKIEAALLEMTSIFADRLTDLFEFDQDLPKPPRAVTDFVERFAKSDEEAAARHAGNHHEQRKSVRVMCAGPATVLPVDRDFAPKEEPFKAAIQDVSEGGIRLLHTRAVYSPYVALNWKAETKPFADIRLVAKVVRCQPRGPFYNISGQFVLAD